MLNMQMILQYLEREGLKEVDPIEYKKNILVYNFFYQFDDVEIESARAYANDNYGEKDNEDQWYDEYYIPYLMDIAADNVNDILNELLDEFDAAGDFVAYEMDRNEPDKCEFVLVISDNGSEFDIDEILGDLNL